MEELNKAAPSTAPVSKPTSESTETSMDFQLISKKEKKFIWLWVFIGLILLSLISVGILVYLKIITLPF